MSASKRKEGEDYEMYRAKLIAAKKLKQAYLRGKVFHSGGTYRKPTGLPTHYSR